VLTSLLVNSSNNVTNATVSNVMKYTFNLTTLINVSVNGVVLTVNGSQPAYAIAPTNGSTVPVTAFGYMP
jgi:hypothetical protein